MAQVSKPYDLVLLGATGYTGKYTAEHITKTFPTNLKWALAGRSHTKLVSLAEELKGYDSDRSQPAIEVVQLVEKDLHALAKKTNVLINTVGPYHLYSTPVVEACASNGTHYLDVTGETPWVKELVQKFDTTAKKSGAIIVPQCGIESSPADMMTYLVSKELQSSTSLKTSEVVYAMHRLNASPSGGTVASLLAVFDSYGTAGLASSSSPQAMCPIEVSRAQSPIPLATKLLGVRAVPDLGTCSTSITGLPDVPIVYRSWGLLSGVGESYGPDFRFSTYLTVRNAFTGILVHVAAILAPLLLTLAPIRWLLRKVLLSPGDGPERQDAARESIEARALALPQSASGQKAFGKWRWDGSSYHLTGVLVSEAAATLLYDIERTSARKLGGGLLTPATLGQPYADRLIKAKVKFETRMLRH